MLRCVLTFGFLAVYLTVTAPFALIETYICEKRNLEINHKAAWRCIRGLFFVCTILSGARLTYKGQEKIPTDGPVLYAANHKGYFDIILSFRGFAGPTGYVAKKELNVFTLGAWMKQISCIFIDRKDPKSAIAMIKQSVENLNKGVSVCIFPEGTRSKDLNSIGEFPNGSFKAALRAGVPIVPVSITGTRNMWEMNYPRVVPSDVCIEFGDPIDTKSLSKEEQKHIGATVWNKVWDMYKRNMEESGRKIEG